MLNWIFYSTEIVKRDRKTLTFRVSVDDLEIEPLGMTLGINVIFKPQVVFNVVHFNGSSQICIFESTVKNKHVFLLWNIYSVCMSWLSSHERIIIVRMVIC